YYILTRMEEDSFSSIRSNRPNRQKALVLQGGGALGAYEAGVLGVLCKKLAEEDDVREDGLLFDIVAGTSIGAMNAAIFVSQFLETRNWDKAAEKLQKFWTDQLAVKGMDISEKSKPWYDHWKKREKSAASPEEARRYFSVRRLLLDEVGNNMYYLSENIMDNRFFDNLYEEKGPNTDNSDCKDPNCKKPNFLNNFWPVHNSKPLQESIEKYANLPISTDYKDNQPRLLIFSVDVAEGVTVTFDSYPKTDGSRKSVYGRFKNEIIIDYNKGIDIQHVMASGTVPEFYKYAKVPIHAKDKQVDEGSTSNPVKINGNDKDIRYFFDGGWLSNTPFRELLVSHQDYWKNKLNGGNIPDLDVYIVNVRCSKFGGVKLREDYDGVKERANDILYSDRTSNYDEKMAHLITAYTNFCNKMNNLVVTAIGDVKDKEREKELDNERKTVLTTKIDNIDGEIHPSTYEDLLSNAFNLSVVMRIERAGYVNNISKKTGDLTLETISKLIIEGRCDAWFTIIEKSISDAI
ncbi:MAG: patatin-like phospholipase family protein, partial [Nitrososphaeraceae archaeon]